MSEPVSKEERSDSTTPPTTPEPKKEIVRTGKSGRPKGYPRTGGRVKGQRNANSLTIQSFSQKLFKRPAFQKNLKARWDDLTIDPSLARLFMQYGYGRPPEKLEISGPGGKPIEQRVLFYMPSNGREAAPVAPKKKKEKR